jgi:purine-binding chemotaxis protein CheW
MSQDTTPLPVADGIQTALSGKYLSFLLQAEEYGVRILRVREIIAIQDVTPLPRMPEYIRGVINLRGRIIPIIDLRLKLGMTAPENTAHTCIIVLEVEGQSEGEIVQIGCVVDTVSEVLDIAAGQVEPPPRFGSSIPVDFILGLGKVGEENQEKVIALIDIDRVLSQSEVSELTREASESTAA